MKALSIRQPFCEQILTGQKTREFRSWATKHRGPLLIHAAASRDELRQMDPAARLSYPLGAVVGCVDVIGCEELIGDGDDPYATTSYAWLLANPRRLTAPIPLKGRLGLFEVEIAEELLARASRK